MLPYIHSLLPKKSSGKASQSQVNLYKLNYLVLCFVMLESFVL